MLVSDLITATFEDLGFIAVGENITAAIQADAFARLNPIQDQLSAEGLTIPNQVMQKFALLAGSDSYLLGSASSGGTFATTGGLRAMKVTGWRAVSGGMVKGGRVLSLAEFGPASAALQKELGELNVQSLLEGQIANFPGAIVAPIPSIVAADTAYPLINVRISPVPSAGPGQLELAYWTPLVSFATVGDPITMPPGWIKLLRTELAVDLFAQYGRPSMKDVIAGNAQQAKAALITQNAMSAPQPQPAAPNGQQ